MNTVKLELKFARYMYWIILYEKDSLIVDGPTPRLRKQITKILKIVTQLKILVPTFFS